MEIKKPNDILVTLVLEPNANVYDLRKSNILPDNTSFLDKETYKNTEFVKKAFTDKDGIFNDKEFNNAYNKAAYLYAEVSNDQHLADALEWDAHDFMRPVGSKSKEATIEIVRDINPYGNLYGRTSLQSIDTGNLSIRELSQKSKVFDPSTGKELDYSPNELGLFGALFNDTLIYAAWEEDGMHIDQFTNREVSHKKGEQKLNNIGQFYTEKLGDREVAGKQVVNPSDLITVDGSAYNKVDFFDSDGLNKSITGTTLKLGMEIAPYLIPKFNTFYGAFKAATNLAAIIPTLYKATEGAILGDSRVGNETALWKEATKAEGFSARFNTKSYSDEASGSMANYEQLGSMLSSVFGQIYEQRAAASLSKIFFKINDPKYANSLVNVAEKELSAAVQAGNITSKVSANQIGIATAEKVSELSKLGIAQSRLAAKLSTGYMALTSTANMYHDALAAGYDRRTAGLAAYAAMAGQYGIMSLNNNRMQTWFLDKGVGYDESASKFALRSALKDPISKLDKAVKLVDVNKEAGKKGIIKALGDLKNFMKDALINPSELKEQIYKNSLIEGFEEVTEQAVLDATKGTVDALSWLGLTSKRGSFNTIGEVFSQKGLETYITNLLGGALGGALFEVNRLRIEPLINGKAISPETQYSIIRMIANGKSKELKEEATKMIKALGNNSLSPIVTEVDGKPIYLVDEKTSQADVIVQGIHKYIDYIDDIMNSEKLKEGDENIVRKTILDKIKEIDLENTGIHTWIISDYNELAQEIVELKTALNSLPEDADKSENTAKLNEKRDQIKEMLSGEKSEYYKQLSLFSLNRELHSPFLSLNVVDYTKDKHNKDYNSLPKEGGTLSKDKLDKEFKEFMESPDGYKKKMKYIFSNFDAMLQRYSNEIGDYSEEAHVKSREKYTKLLNDSGFITPENVSKFSEALKKYSNITLKLDETFNLPLGDIMRDNDYLDLTHLSEEDSKNAVNLINQISKNIPSRELSPKLIQSVINEQFMIEMNKLNESKAKELLDPAANSLEINIKYENLAKEILTKYPKVKNANSEVVIPFELIYFANELSKEKEIPQEIAEIVKIKGDELFNEVKKRLDLKNLLSIPKLLFSTAPDFKDFLFEDYDNSKSTLLDSMINTFANFDNRIKKAKNLEEIDIISKELKQYADSLTKITMDFVILNKPTIDWSDPSINEEITNDVNKFKETIDNSLEAFKDIKNPMLDKVFQLYDKPIIENKLFDILNKVNIEIFNDGNKESINILDILRPEINKFEAAGDRPQDYIRTRDVINNMKQVQSILKLMNSINVAMLDSSIDPTTPYGFNVNMKAMAEKIEGGKPNAYKVINAQAYDSLKKELNRIDKKLSFLIGLAEMNSGSIWSNQEAIKDNSIKLFLEALTDSKSKTSALNLSINGVSLLTKEDSNRILSSDKPNEEKLWDIEDIIYNNFQKVSKDNLPDALSQLTNNFKDEDFIKTLLESEGIGLTKNQTSLDNIDYFTYLHSIIALNNKDFYKEYKKVLEKELSLPNKKAPFYAQEYSIRLGYAYLQNKSVMKHVAKFLKDNVRKENNELHTERSILDELFIILGSGGVGKSSVILNYILRMSQFDSNTEFFISASKDKVLNKLKDDVSRDLITPLRAYNEDDLIKELIGDENYNLYKTGLNSLLTRTSKEESDYSTKKESPLDNTKYPEIDSIIEIGSYKSDQINLTQEFKDKLNKIFDKRRIILADEISWFSPLGLQIINHLSTINENNPKGGLYFIGVGDDIQDGFSLSENNNYSVDTFYFNGSPKLKGVIRGKNIHKKDNNENLELVINKTRVWDTPDDAALSISYFQGNLLNGDKFVDSLEISDLKTFDPELNTVIITEDGKLSLDVEEKLKAAEITKYSTLARLDVQGEEFDQVISLVDIKVDEKDKTSLYVGAKKLYTILTRAHHASLIVGNKAIINALGLRNEERRTTSAIGLEEYQIEKELEKRFTYINSIFKDVTTKKVEPKKIDIKQAEIKNTVSLEEPSEIEDLKYEENEVAIKEKDKKDHDGDNKFFAYSFYNILHANDDNESLELAPINNIHSDIQTLDLLYNSEIELNKILKDKKKVVNDFIQLKNEILNRISKVNSSNLLQGNYFKDLDIKSGTVVIRKLKYDNNFIRTYGKQAHISEPEIGKEYLFLTYKGTYKGKEFYITLAGLPDINNPTWSNLQPNNKSFLKDNIFDKLDKLNEISVSGFSIIPYSGIKFIYRSGKSIKTTNEESISISGNTFEEFKNNLEESAPGIMLSYSDKIPVFGVDTEVIEKTMSSVGYSFPGKTPVFKNLNAFRLRPYIKVSYINAADNTVSRIVVLNAKKRTLNTAIEEYIALQNQYKKDTNNKEPLKHFPMLISKWDGLNLYKDLINKLPIGKINQIKELITIMTLKGVNKENREKASNDLKSIFEIMDSKTLKTISDSEKNLMFGNKDIPNIGLKVLEILSDNNYIEKEDLSDLLEKEYYYNGKYESSRTESGEMLLDKEFIKYFEIQSFLEPPTFILDLNNISTVPVTESIIIENKIEDEPLILQPNMQISFAYDNIIDLDTSLWTSLPNLNLALNVLNNSFTTIMDNINILPDANIKESLIQFNKNIITSVMKDSTFISDNGNIDGNKVNNVYTLERRKLKGTDPEAFKLLLTGNYAIKEVINITDTNSYKIKIQDCK